MGNHSIGSGNRNALRAAFALALGAAYLSAQGTLSWTADLDASLEAAKRAQQCTIVYVHEAGEAGSVAMLADMKASAKLPAALGKARLVAVRVGNAEILGPGASEFPGVRAEDLAAHSGRAIRTLFGPRAELLTPQLLVLDPDGGLLVQSIHQRSAAEVVALIDEARKLVGAAAKVRDRQLAERARALAGPQEPTRLDLERLQALATLTPVDKTPLVFEAVAARPELETRLLEAIARVHGWKNAPQRLQAVRCQRNGAEVDALLAKLQRQVPKQRASEGVLALRDPLPIVRPTDALDTVEWLDGRTRTAADLRGSITVLWFFRTDDPALARQVAEVRPAIEELEPLGVRFLGLAVSVDPEKDRTAIRAMKLPFESGTYRPRPSGAEFFGMALYPGTIVLDRNANVVFSDAEDSTSTASSYRFFAPFVRGLLDLESARVANARDSAGAR